MNMNGNDRARGLQNIPHLLAVAFGTFTIVGAVLSLVGWLLPWNVLADWDLDGIAISPNCALCAVLMSTAVILLSYGRVRLAAYLGIAVLAVSLITSLEYITGIDLLIDRILTFGHSIGDATLGMGRMGAPAAAAWALAGAAVILAEFKPGGRKYVPALGLAVSVIGTVTAIGYLFGANPLTNWPRLTMVSSQTSVFIMLVGFGLVLAVREIAPTRVVFANSAAGTIARRTLPFAVILPFAGALRLYVVQLGLLSDTVSVAVFSTGLITLFCVIVWYGIRAVDRHERELNRTQGFVSGLVGSITDGLAAFDKDWNFTFVNDEIIRRTGLSSEELIGKNVWEIFPDSVGGDYYVQLHRAMAEQIPVDHETFYEPWSVWLRDRAYPTPDGGLVVYTEDVTAQKQAENSLEEQRRFTNEIIETAPSLTYIYDIRSGKNIFVSPQVKDVLGYETAELANMGPGVLNNLLHEEDRERIDSHLKSIFHSHTLEESFQIDYRMRHKNGDWVWLDDRARIFARDENGGPTQMLAVATDITARKQAEHRLRESEANERAARIEAESANKAKDEFLAVLSHELRTPLNSMHGWTQILLKEDVDEKTVQKGIEVIDRSIRHQAALIEDLLDVSRIVSGKMAISHETIDLEPVLHTAVETVRPIAQEREMSLRLKIDPDEYILDGDKNRLQQVVGNLLSNAIKFSDRGGMVQVSLEKQNGNAVIQVHDDGLGIEPDNLRDIFQPFWQVDSGYRRRHGGLGLGLTIVRNLVEIHGGSISAYSEGTGKGSTFKIVLPLVNAQVANAAGALSPFDVEGYSSSDALDGLRILVVDDDIDTLDLMRYAIEGQGATVTYCSTVNEALSKIYANEYDLLISDIGMAGLSGYDLISKVRDDHDLKELPAIALSGYVSSLDKEQALDGGYQRYLPKPVDFHKLTLTIKELIANRSFNNGA